MDLMCLTKNTCKEAIIYFLVLLPLHYLHWAYLVWLLILSFHLFTGHGQFKCFDGASTFGVYIKLL